jgi:hypothetical protein
MQDIVANKSTRRIFCLTTQAVSEKEIYTAEGPDTAVRGNHEVNPTTLRKAGEEVSNADYDPLECH